MNELLRSFVNGIHYGPLQQSGALAVLPILADLPTGPDYLTLPEALAAGAIAITEVSESGSVPELAVVNQSDMPVLLLDGEELAGAKQNRVVNTTILLKQHSKTVIPVSCVEQGRWQYASREFQDSGNVMAAQLRVRKQRAVSDSLSCSGRRASDQGDVWDGVNELAMEFGVHSSTGAMRDVYHSVADDLEEMLRAFTPVPGQRGMAVCVHGKVAGVEYLSQPRAFAKVFEKLLRSYALDALKIREPEKAAISPDEAHTFLALLATSAVQSYEAVGHGYEHRVSGQAVVGSALTVEEAVVHLSLLATTNKKSPRRRGHDEAHEVPFSRSYWVHPTELLAGCYPGAPDSREAERKLAGLLDAGIRCVINLMEPEETDHHGNPFVPYEPVLQRLAVERGITIQCINMPIPDQCVPTKQFMSEILDLIDECIIDPEGLTCPTPTYIHCWGGKGRTGTVVGCWLARHGIANGDEALRQVQYLRRNDPTANQPSPENRIQCNMVRKWQEGE